MYKGIGQEGVRSLELGDTGRVLSGLDQRDPSFIEWPGLGCEIRRWSARNERGQMRRVGVRRDSDDEQTNRDHGPLRRCPTRVRDLPMNNLWNRMPALS